ncbi:hypothetical protein BGZ82_011622, partial [Podila clonocystis]
MSIATELQDAVSQVLASIRWSTLKSFVLSGDRIDEWINLWPASVESQMLCLAIHGTGSAPQELSHSSFLWIQQLIFTSQLVLLHFIDVQLQDDRDWMLIVESLEPSLLHMFNLYSVTAGQFRYLPLRVEHNPDEAYTVVDKVSCQIVSGLEHLFDVCEHFYVRLGDATNMARANFLQIAANTRYHHALLLEKITELDPDQVKIQVGGRSREKIQKRLSKLEQQVSHWNQQNITFNMFRGVHT